MNASRAPSGHGPDRPAGPRVRRFADLAARILDTPAHLGRVRLVAIDGTAGSGKSTFARRLAAALRDARASTTELHTDDLLDGWTDLVAFWPRLEAGVLAPLAAGWPGSFHAYDWNTGRFRQEATSVPVSDVLLIEGVTSARAAVRKRLSLAVYLVAPRAVCLARGLARDGEALRPQWLHWMAAEEAYFAGEPNDPGAVFVDGAPTVPHDQEQEYVEGESPPVTVPA